MSELIFERVTKRYGEKTVLRDFCLRVRPGEPAVLMGPSGCGKTTALLIAAGLLPPDAGRVTGRPERLSVVFQEDRLCEDFTVYRNLRLVRPELTRQEALGHLAALGLEDSLDTPARELSGGMKRRAALARAGVYAGELYLLDEPFRGLDEAARDRAADYVRRLAAGKALLLVTHDPDVPALFGARPVLLASP